MFMNDHMFHLHKILPRTKVPSNLLSIHHLRGDNDLIIEFGIDSFFVKKAHTEKILAQGAVGEVLYKINGDVLDTLSFGIVSSYADPWAYTSSVTNSVWHTRLAHHSNKFFDILVHKSMLPYITAKNKSLCFVFPLAKSHILPFNSKHVMASKPFLSHLYGYLDMIERTFFVKLKSILTNGGGKFQFLNTHLSALGLNHRVIFPSTLEKNVVVKSRNKRVVEKGLALLLQGGLPTIYWLRAFRTTNFTMNRLPSVVLQSKCSYWVLYGKSNEYNSLKSFGCKCYPGVRSFNKHKP